MDQIADCWLTKSAPGNTINRLYERILGLSPTDLARAQDNPTIRRLRAECLAWDNVAEALMTEIRVGIDQANSKLRSAEDKAILVNQAVEHALHERDVMFQDRENLQAKYDELSAKYFEAIGSLDQAVDLYQYQNLPHTRIQLQKAQDAVQQAEAAVEKAQIAAMEAQAEVQSCFDENFARQQLGDLAIGVVQRDQEDHNEDLWEHIRAILDQQDEQGAMGTRRTRSRGGQELGYHTPAAR